MGRALVKIKSGRDEVGRAMVKIKSGRGEVDRALVNIGTLDVLRWSGHW